MRCLKNLIHWSPSLVAAISFAGCAASGADQGSSEDALVHEFQVGGQTIVAVSEKTALGWRTTVTDDGANTVYADVHVADSDGIWTGTIAGIDMSEPAAIPVAEWRRAYQSEAGQIVMATSLQARSLPDETNPAATEPAESELLFTVGSLAGILGGQAEVASGPELAGSVEDQAEVAPGTEQKVPYSIFGVSYTYITSKYLICTGLHPRRYAAINAQYGAKVSFSGHPDLSNDWNTSAYYTFKASNQFPSGIGKVSLYHDSRGKVAWWTTRCTTGLPPQ